MSRRRGRGCGCCCGFVVLAVGCTSGAVAGCAVTISQGGTTIGSGTTDASGTVRFTVPHGTYDVAITGPSGAGFAVFSASVAFTCTTSDMTYTANLAADSSHVCVSCCNYPVPKTLTLTDGLGSRTLTYSATGTTGIFFTITPGWYASTTYGATTYVTGGGDVCTADGSSVPIGYMLQCGTGGFIYAMNWPGTNCGSGPCTTVYASTITFPAENIGGQAGSTLVSLTCYPFNLSFTVPTSAAIPGCSGVGTPGGGGTVTITP